MVSRPHRANILHPTWAFKKNVYPEGSLKKYKSSLCVRRDQQIEEVDLFETYAPVVSWITVRLVFVLSLVIGLQNNRYTIITHF